VFFGHKNPLAFAKPFWGSEKKFLTAVLFKAMPQKNSTGKRKASSATYCHIQLAIKIIRNTSNEEEIGNSC